MAPGIGYSEAGLKITDHRGKQHHLLTPPKRVVSLSPVSTEFLFAVGAGSAVIGRTSNCNYPPAVEKIRDIGSLFPADFELIMSQRPDLIVMSDGNLKIRARLESLGIPVFVIHPRTLAGIADTIDTLGAVMGTTQVSQQVSLRFRDQISSLRAPSSSGPTVMYEVWSKPLTTAGSGTFIADVIRLSGGRNIVQTGTEDWPRISTEWAVSQNPDVILTTGNTQRDRWLVEGVPGWGETKAIRKRHVFAVPNEDIFVRPGPRVIEALKWLKPTLESLKKEPK